MQYYMILNGQQVGPFEPHHMVANGLTPTTQVWCEAMTDWAPAHTVYELASYLPQAQQPYQQGGYQQQYQQPAYGNGYGQQNGSQQYDPSILLRQRQVGFGEAISRAFQNYANFSGRASRSEFWWWDLFCCILMVPLSLLSFIFLMNSSDLGPVFSILIIIASLSLVLPSLAICWRRLHDIGKSGAWYLIGCIPYVNFITSIILLVWYCKESEPRENEYGPVPNVD